MTKTKLTLRILAVVALIPALVLFANFAAYAFFGHGFLVSSAEDGDLSAARITTAFIGVSLFCFLFGAST